MKQKQKGMLIAIMAVGLVVVGCSLILLVESQTKMIRRWIDDVVYDSRYHYLACEQLPLLSEVEKVLEEHQIEIQEIEAVNPGLVGVEVHTCGAGKADITFWYASHRDRVAIVAIIGGETFFGVPYNLNNR